MRVMFTIHAIEADAAKAEEIKNKIEAMCKEYSLDGSVRGDASSKMPSYTGSFTSSKKSKKAKPKFDPKQFDPSQYFKPKEVKKEE